MGEHWPTPSKKAIGLLGKEGLGYFCYCVGLLAIPGPQFSIENTLFKWLTNKFMGWKF
jgi:hypothetical protein